MENTNSKTIAQKCGERLRRARQAKNMSQQELADLMGTTPQNISKWEKSGIANIDDICRLSDILQQNLQTEERDEEGSVGEIGKEILRLLVEAGGVISYEHVLENLYGLDNEVTTWEIVKLSRIGMCVREQYIDFYDDKQDYVFITAKGKICFNNSVRKMDWKNTQEGTTYELILAEYYDEDVHEKPFERYQDIIDGYPVEKMIRNLPCVRANASYRYDYIRWIMSRGYIKVHSEMRWGGFDNDSYKATGFYVDTIMKMMMGITSNDIDSAYCYDDVFEISGVEKTTKDVCRESDDFWKESKNRIFAHVIDAYEVSVPFEEVLPTETSELNVRNEDCTILNPDYFYLKMVEEKGLEQPTDWFTDEEILQYINDNYYEAQTEEQHHIDDMLKEIGRLEPSIYDYFDLPPIWKGTEIERRVREIFNIPEEIEVCKTVYDLYI